MSPFSTLSLQFLVLALAFENICPVFGEKGVFDLVSEKKKELFGFVERNSMFVIVFVSIVFFLPVYFVGFPEGHDTSVHISWFSLFSNEFLNGNFYPRFLVEGNYGWGSPAFVYYPPLAYWVGSIIDFIIPSENYLSVINTVCILASVLGSVGMYMALRGVSAFSRLIGVLLYALAPYHLYADFFVRGAVTEYLAMGLMPWLFVSLEEKDWLRFVLKKGIIVFLISICNAPSIILSVVGFGIFWFLYNYSILLSDPKEWFKRMASFGGAVLLGILAAGFYLFPALTTENPVMHVMWDMYNYSSNYLEPIPVQGDISAWKAKNFPEVLQLVYFLPFVAAVGVLIRTSTVNKCIFFSAVILLFLTSSLSGFVYELLPVFQKIQFPWRWLAILTVVQCLLVARLSDEKAGRLFYISQVVVVAFSLLLIAKAFYSQERVSAETYELWAYEYPQPPEYEIVDDELAKELLPACKAESCKAWNDEGMQLEVEEWSSDLITIKGSFKAGQEVFLKRAWWGEWTSSDPTKYGIQKSEANSLVVEVSESVSSIQLSGSTYGYNYGIYSSVFATAVFLLLLIIVSRKRQFA